MKNSIIYTGILIVNIFTLGFFNSALAQVPTPAEEQSKSILLWGAKAHLGNGKVIEQSAIGFKDGKITLVESSVGYRPTTDWDTTINLDGKDIYPGLIAPNTVLGLIEIGAVRATRDTREVGSNNANTSTNVAYNTDSRVTPTIRSNGILVAQIAPQGGRVSGNSSLVQLDAWNWEDATLKDDDGIYVSWPSMFNKRGWWAEPGPTEKNEKYAGQVKQVYHFFDEAKAYSNKSTIEKKNLKFESIKGVFDGSKKVYVRADGVKQMMGIIEFKEKYGFDVVIVGAKDSWKVADLLAEKNIPVIYNMVHDLPEHQDDDIDQAYKTPKVLQDAGVEFCLSIGGYWEVRNLAFHAGTAAAYGLTKEQAIASITSSTAKIMGLDNVGSIEVGKDATIIISSGDVMDMRTSNIEHAFISGRKIDLNNKQKMLYEKFAKKFGIIE